MSRSSEHVDFAYDSMRDDEACERARDEEKGGRMKHDIEIEFSEDDNRLYDVVAVSTDDNSILWVDELKTLPNAEAIVAMAVMRQGCEDRFFSEVPHGRYKQGDKWHGQ